MRWALLLSLLATQAFAHKGADTLWRLRATDQHLDGRFDVSIRDLQALLALDANADRTVTWGELRTQTPAVHVALERALIIHQKGTPCPLHFGAVSVVRHSDGLYAAIPVSGSCPAAIHELELQNDLLFALDPTQRGLLALEGVERGDWIAFTADTRVRTVTFEPHGALWQLQIAVEQGVHHIAIGWDHLCFLFALLLPSVLRREGTRWIPKETFRPALWDVLRVVTAFTVAHSFTLGLAAFGVVTPNAALVEVAIALSVALAALNNLVPFVADARWSLAFSLGLLHGFGFVSAIHDLGSDGPSLWRSVLGFNVGVELGQLGIVACFVPLAWLLRSRSLYLRVLLPLASAGILGIAAWWTWERI